MKRYSAICFALLAACAQTSYAQRNPQDPAIRESVSSSLSTTHRSRHAAYCFAQALQYRGRNTRVAREAADETYRVYLRDSGAVIRVVPVASGTIAHIHSRPEEGDAIRQLLEERCR
jgi:hypothetical protein